MKFEVGQVWLTRDGRRARILATDLKSKHTYLIVLVVTNEDGTENVLTCIPDGGYLISLAPKEVVVELWVNIVQGDGAGCLTYLFETKQEAIHAFHNGWKVLARAVPFVWKGEVG